MASNNYNIKNAQGLLSQAGSLAQINQNILRVQEQLTSCCKEVSNAWQSDTEDRASYLGNLEKNLVKIQRLCAAIEALSRKLTTFAEDSIRNANNS